MRATIASNFGALEVRRELGEVPRRAPARGPRNRPGQQVADALDRRGGVRVALLDVRAVLREHVHEDRDRVLEVIEHDQHVAEHQRHVRQAQRVGVRLAERLDGPHEVVREEPDGTAGERRQIGQRRLRPAPDLRGGQRIRVARVAERPAQHRPRPDPDEAVAPDALPLLGRLQEERRLVRGAGAQLEERRDRRLAVVDEDVPQGHERVVPREGLDLGERGLDRQGGAAHDGPPRSRRIVDGAAPAPASSSSRSVVVSRIRCSRATAQCSAS